MDRNDFQITVKTLEGLEEVLAREIEGIGGQEVTKGNRSVHFRGDTIQLYRANYRLRTALRVFKEIVSFRFSSADDFYLKCFRVRWEQYMELNNTFAVQSTVVQSGLFRNSMYASLKLKDAIADHFRQKKGSRPDVDTSEPDLLFHVHINGDACTLGIDSSGESLHKRGYRISAGEAPLNEVLAAGMILLAGWKGGSDFIDPMCGSGTLPIEAALIARNIPPGKFRKSFAFMSWKDFDRDLFQHVREEAVPAEFNHSILAADLNPAQVTLARTNARNARVFNLIRFQTADFRELQPELPGALLIFNPPYGERLRESNLEGLYQMIGERLKHHYAGSTAWILSSAPELHHQIGLKASEKIKLFNGALACSFQKYDLFEGRRKTLVIARNLKQQRGISPDIP